MPKGSSKLETCMLGNGQDMIWFPGGLWRIWNCTKLGSSMLVFSVLPEFADYTVGFASLYSVEILGMLSLYHSFLISFSVEILGMFRY